ncbi:hypothetical protein V6N11_036489 [Hibiscus sabdariffa]|uniref:Uncharacterized protein n=1 Tax=Hibiscus sabdariffa TaxID=183260 RepID=A0ABR2RB32_9ROSI
MNSLKHLIDPSDCPSPNLSLAGGPTKLDLGFSDNSGVAQRCENEHGSGGEVDSSSEQENDSVSESSSETNRNSRPINGGDNKWPTMEDGDKLIENSFGNDYGETTIKEPMNDGRKLGEMDVMGIGLKVKSCCMGQWWSIFAAIDRLYKENGREQVQEIALACKIIQRRVSKSCPCLVECCLTLIVFSSSNLISRKMRESMKAHATSCNLKELVQKFILEIIGKDIERNKATSCDLKEIKNASSILGRMCSFDKSTS